jgi:hypothetical protein
MQMTALVQDIRKTPIYRQLIPLEAQVGWPIPLRRKKRVLVTLPFFSIERISSNQQNRLYPPFATITLDWSNQVPVEYVDLRFRHPWPQETNWEQPVGAFPHPAVAELSVGQYEELRTKLLTMYDHLMETLSENKALSDDWKKEFSLLLRILMEPSLEAYYRSLGQNFFEIFLPYLKAPGT